MLAELKARNPGRSLGQKFTPTLIYRLDLETIFTELVSPATIGDTSARRLFHYAD
jgi:hypothetical protein